MYSSLSFGNALGWMNRAGSVGFQSPVISCHWRLIPAMNWKPCDRFLVAVSSRAVYFNWPQLLLVC
jgi:hypothetical protein